MSLLVYKLLGGATVLVFAYFLRQTLCDGRREVTAQIEGYLALFGTLRRGIAYYRAPIGDLLARCEPSVLEACAGLGEAVRADSLSALVEQSDFGSEALRSIVTDAAQQLGRGYHDEQLAACDKYLAALGTLLETHKKRETERSQVVGTLIYTAAVGGILLLL